MDRVTVYPGALPREVDILYAGKFPMVGLGYLAEAGLGADPVVDGLALAATTPASMSLTLDRGSIYQQANVDTTAFSSLPIDSKTIIKQGIRDTAGNIPFTAPATVGFSQVFLVEAQYVDDDDDDLIALPYYNADDPTDPFTGPGNNGQTQPTTRRGKVAVQVKAGVAATAGTQVAPTPDAGWVGLWLVTLNAGQTTITSSSIARYPSAPFIDTKLPQVPRHAQSGRWTYAVASGTNALTCTLTPQPTEINDGMMLQLAITAANTGAATLQPSGFPAASILGFYGGALAAGDLRTGQVIPFIRRSGAWRSLVPLASDIKVPIAEYSPQRIAFGQYFTDDNPIALASTHYDTDLPTSMPPLALKVYEYVYNSAFPDEKTIVNIVIISNIYVTRPGNSLVNAYVRGRVVNATSTNRNNYVTIDSNSATAQIPANSKSISFSMLAGKDIATPSLTLQVYSWWGAQTANVSGNPYSAFFDDCEMLIIERVVDALPSLPYAD